MQLMCLLIDIFIYIILKENFKTQILKKKWKILGKFEKKIQNI